MKPNENVIDIQSTLTGDEVSMSFDENSLAHLMQVLTDLYSDPEQAVIREYSTNAYDAHVEAGTNRPIEVDLPGPLSPFLKIRDFGVGLTVDDIHNIYAKFGASTKRGTNAQNGMLGLGCKSALTYTSQFTLTSVKDGTKIQVVVSRDESGGGKMTVVDTSATTESNGTEVSIPVRNSRTLEMKALRFFSFWPKGSVLVNGKEPKRFEFLIEITPTIFIIEDTQSYVVMGNVAYPADITHGLPYNRGVVAFVEIGEVNFPPNREALQYTTKTKTRITQIQDEYQAGIKAAFEKEVAQADTPWGAIQKRRSFRESGLPVPSSVAWKGKPLPASWMPVYSDGYSQKGLETSELFFSPRHSSVLSRSNRVHRLSSESWNNFLWIVGYDAKSLSAPQKKKTEKYVTDTGGFEHIDSFMYLADAKTMDDIREWIDPANIVNYADIKAVKLPKPVRVASVSSRIPGSYDFFEDGGYCQYGVPGDNIRQGHPIFWYRGDQYVASKINKLLSGHHKKFTLVILQKNRIEKFQRNVPKCIKANDEVNRLVKNFKDSVKPRELEALAMRQHVSTSDFAQMDAGKIHDPALRAAIELAKVKVDHIQNAINVFHEVSHQAVRLDLPNWNNPLLKYPLLRDRYNGIKTITPKNETHFYCYINAAFDAGIA